MLGMILDWLASSDWMIETNESTNTMRAGKPWNIADVTTNGEQYFALKSRFNTFRRIQYTDIDGIALSFKHKRVYIQFKESE